MNSSSPLVLLFFKLEAQWQKLKLPQSSHCVCPSGFKSSFPTKASALPSPPPGLSPGTTAAKPPPGFTRIPLNSNVVDPAPTAVNPWVSLHSSHLISLLRRFYLFTLSSLITSQAAQVGRQRLPGAGWLPPEEPAADPLHQEVPQQRRVEIQRVQELLGAVQTGTTIPESVMKRTLWVERRKKKHFYYRFIN